MSSKPPGFASPPPSGHQQPWNGGAPKYINDFTKALAGEVRILLEEVGKLRDERRALQTEIAELMAIKAKQSAGGDYSPGWGPPTPMPMEEPIPPTPPPVEAPALEGPQEPVRPGWRTVYKKKERTPRTPRAITAPPVPATPAPAPPPIIPPDPPAAKLPAWAHWRPNPQFQPPVASPRPITPASPMSVPPRAGLFGPSTPPP